MCIRDRVIIRGLRAVTDFEYELQMAQTNRVLAQDIDTVFMTTSLEYAYLSSTIMKEVASFGGEDVYKRQAWLLVIYRNRRHNGYRKEDSVKESREQPKNGALKQAIEK